MADELFDLLQLSRLTSVVDIGAREEGPPPAYKGMLDRGLCSFVGFEPQPEDLQMLRDKAPPNARYLPYVVGDGQEAQLNVCSGRGMTSLLEPDPVALDLFRPFWQWGAVEERIPVATRRLDDIEDVEAIDLLKIDVQGSELAIFRSGMQKLARAVAIETEVSFMTLYENQPPLGVVDTQLRSMGFVPHAFTAIKTWPISPSDLTRGSRQLLEADMLYVRDFSRVENMDAGQWQHLAMIAHHCYGSVDLALRAIGCAAQLNALSPLAVDLYRDMINTRSDPQLRTR